jgi:ubiquinone/menaquinone biosynthesis C-methylase UbiE
MSNEIGHRYGKVVEEFDVKANSYDQLHLTTHSIMGLHQRLRNLWVTKLSVGKGKTLEVGCGTGINSKNLSDQMRYIGIDISMGMTKQCRQKFLDVCQANGETLPFKDESFDCVLCINALQYFGNLPAVMMEIKRVLKPEGRFIFDFKNRISARATYHGLTRIRGKTKGIDLETRHSLYSIQKILRKIEWKIDRMIGTEFHFLPMNMNSMDNTMMESIFKIEKYLGSTWLRYFAGRILLSVRHVRNQGW